VVAAGIVLTLAILFGLNWVEHRLMAKD